ncbi:VapE domain-containing protein [Planococcus dechangensis]|uniref:VapE domain-containing protein n=1 Tax=Planococcus dechangensis TaxID=1176255 RepID=A0ABV9MHG3_9BACL
MTEIRKENFQDEQKYSIPPEVQEVIEKAREQKGSTTKKPLDFVLNKDGAIKKTLSNLRLMLLLTPQVKGIGFDEFAQEITVNMHPITDEFIVDLRLSVDREYSLTFTKEDILQMVSSIAREKNSYHPIKQHIESKVWDGKPRADSLFIDYLGADDNAYSRAVARKWLAGAVARIYEPGVKMEMVPVLQGKQGVGKSTLASKLGGGFFVDSLASLGKSKDDYQLLIGSWIIELGELASFNSTETEKVKSFISAKFDKIRLPYSVIPQKYYRTCVFIGTTNNSEFLNDLTGNRRFFPIPLKNSAELDIFKLDDETIQQIWAEAFLRYKEGEKLFLDVEADLEAAEEYRNQATEESLFFISINDFLEMKVPENWDSMNMDEKRYQFENSQRGRSVSGASAINKTTAKEIAYMLGLDAKDRNANSQAKKIKLYMDNREDWESKPVLMKGKTQRGYKRK